MQLVVVKAILLSRTISESNEVGELSISNPNIFLPFLSPADKISLSLLFKFNTCSISSQGIISVAPFAKAVTIVELAL